MKHLFNQVSRGYSWSNDHSYYLCETVEEYEAICKSHLSEIEECKEKGKWCPDYCYEGEISCSPTTEVSDGFATSGGRTLKGVGFTRCYKRGCGSSDYSFYRHYLKPNEEFEMASERTTSWWV